MGSSHRHRLTAMPPPPEEEAFGFIIGVGGGCCYRVLPQSSLRSASSLPEGALSYFSTQLHGSRLFRRRRDARQGERRTNLQRESQDMVRPREAIGARTIQCKVKIGAKGGVQRGQMSPMQSQLPPLALFASFSGLRKKRQHRCQLTKKRTIGPPGRGTPSVA